MATSQDCVIIKIKLLLRYFVHYHDIDNNVHYFDNNKFLDTTVNYIHKTYRSVNVKKPTLR